MGAVARWADLLAAWEIPAALLAQASESPWVLPREVFVRRADRQIADPIGATHREARAALATPGTVLDVGAAAGATSLPLAGRAPVTAFTAVDADAVLLEAFAERASAAGIPARCLRGRWPDLAAEAGASDVVLAGNVIYNVPDLGPFVAALTAHARRTVIVELADRHPLVDLNPLWQHFHGITRPTGPTADDAVAALTELGVRPTVHRWRRPPEPEHATYADLVDVTRRRLCLPPDAAPAVDTALRAHGVDPTTPPDLGSSGRHLTTLGWPGAAT